MMRRRQLRGDGVHNSNRRFGSTFTARAPTSWRMSDHVLTTAPPGYESAGLDVEQHGGNGSTSPKQRQGPSAVVGGTSHRSGSIKEKPRPDTQGRGSEGGPQFGSIPAMLADCDNPHPSWLYSVHQCNHANNKGDADKPHCKDLAEGHRYRTERSGSLMGQPAPNTRRRCTKIRRERPVTYRRVARDRSGGTVAVVWAGKVNLSCWQLERRQPV